MSLISDLEVEVQDRLEEARDGVGVFWDLQNEIRPLIVEAMNVATLITGDPEVRPKQMFTVAPGQNLQTMPSGGLALLRVEGVSNLPIKKVQVKDLDRHYYQWQNDSGDVPQLWFPFGLGAWGVYPKLTAEVQVRITYVGFPVNEGRPYSGAEALPFQDEYREAFSDYATHAARLKEGGAEFDESIAGYNRFLSRMQEMSKYAYRKGVVRFTMAPGATAAGTTDVKGS